MTWLTKREDTEDESDESEGGAQSQWALNREARGKHRKTYGGASSSTRAPPRSSTAASK